MIHDGIHYNESNIWHLWREFWQENNPSGGILKRQPKKSQNPKDGIKATQTGLWTAFIIFHLIPMQAGRNGSKSASSLTHRLIQRLRLNNYMLVYRLHIDLIAATALYLIREIQIISMLALPSKEGAAELRGMLQIFRFCEISVFKFPVSDQLASKMHIWISLGLLVLQVCFLALMFVSSRKQSLNQVFSQFICVVAILTQIPIAVNFSTSLKELIGGSYGAETLICALSFILLLGNQFIYSNYHFCFSIKRSLKNVLARFPRPIIFQYLWIFIACLSQFVNQWAYPAIFEGYVMLVLALSIVEGQHFSMGIQFFEPKMNRNLGILSLLTITFAIADLSYFWNITLLRQSLVTFIIFFYLFFVNFFLTFGKFWLKRIIIDDITVTEPTQITYALSYIIFFSNITDKKNETYLSSLLKNHCNNCPKLDCCCKHRDRNYDPATKKTGNSSIQPHLDIVFIKQFLLDVIKDSIQEFPKSTNLKLFMGLFYLEYLELSSEIVKSIKHFHRKTISNKISLSQKFANYCLEQEFYELVRTKNQKDGDKKCEEARLFDEYLSNTRTKVYLIILNLKEFWEKLEEYSQVSADKEIEPQFLKEISHGTLSLMRDVGEDYEKMKAINRVSSELKEVMTLYSKQVAHDIDFFNQIKEEIKNEKMAKRAQPMKKEKELNIYSSETANLMIENGEDLIWISSNAASIFGYSSRAKMLKAKVSNLMPYKMGKDHASKVRKWEETGECNKMNQCINVWCTNYSGFSFRCLIYTKVMPNLVKRDIEYYVAVEKLGRNEIICEQDGEILGFDTSFQSILRTFPKILQANRVYFQLFFPLAFEHFFEFFFKGIWTAKKKAETQYCSYIPGKIKQYIETTSKELETLDKKYKKSNSHHSTFTLFLQNKMQEITTEPNGRYATAHMDIEFHSLLGRQLVIFTLNREDSDSIAMYYEQLEKTIQLINKCRESAEKRLTSIFRKVENASFMNNPFEIFHNPKKLNKLLRGESCLEERKLGLNERKQRALNRIESISNPIAKGALVKIKEALYRNNIISAELFRSLIEHEDEDNCREQMLVKNETYMFPNNDDNDSAKHLIDIQQELESVEQSKGADVSFQESAASSAVFISMSTKIRILKNKLREVKAPRLLRWAHVCFILILAAFTCHKVVYVCTDSEASIAFEKQIRYNMDTFQIFSDLMLARTIQTVDMPEREELEGLKQYFMNEAMAKIQANCMDVGGATQTMGSFPSKQFGGMSMLQIFLEEFSKIQQDLPGMNSTIFHRFKKYFQAQYEKVSSGSFPPTQLPETLIFIFAFTLSLALIALNVRLSDDKIKQMTGLLAKLYPQERKKYHDHFVKLPLVVQNFGYDSISNSLASPNEQRQPQSCFSDNRFLYKCLGALFAVLLALSLTQHLIRSHYVREAKSQVQAFNQIIMGKIDLSEMVLLVQMQRLEPQQFDLLAAQILAANQDVPKMLISLFKSVRTSTPLRNRIVWLSESNICAELPSFLQLCEMTGSGTFTHGILNSFYYIPEVANYYSQIDPSDREPSNITELIQTNSINSIFANSLFQTFLDEVVYGKAQLNWISLFVMVAAIIVSLLCLILEWVVYRQIASRFSRYNTILLMIPFDVLVENPYIKLYLREQFGLRSLSY